jgi:hypothetical protein
MFATGTIIIFGAILKWDIFFHEEKSGFIHDKFGPNGERWVYAIIGILIILMGCYILATGKFAPQ